MNIEENDHNNNTLIFTEKIYVSKDKRVRSNGEQYTYNNYKVYFDYKVFEIMGTAKFLFIYRKDGEIYLTNTKPDGSVPSKKLTIYAPQGTNKREFDGRRRSFMIPKMFFNVISNQRAKLTVDFSKTDLFSGKALIKLELV